MMTTGSFPRLGYPRARCDDLRHAALTFAQQLGSSLVSSADQVRVGSKRIDPLTKATMSEDQVTDVPPNHLSIDERSPFYSEEALIRGVGIRFNGAEKTNVHEYNVAEGWVRVEVPTAKDRRGNPMIIKLSGTVEPYFRTAE